MLRTHGHVDIVHAPQKNCDRGSSRVTGQDHDSTYAWETSRIHTLWLQHFTLCKRVNSFCTLTQLVRMHAHEKPAQQTIRRRRRRRRQTWITAVVPRAPSRSVPHQPMHITVCMLRRGNYNHLSTWLDAMRSHAPATARDSAQVTCTCTSRNCKRTTGMSDVARAQPTGLTAWDSLFDGCTDTHRS